MFLLVAVAAPNAVASPARQRPLQLVDGPLRAGSLGWTYRLRLRMALDEARTDGAGATAPARPTSPAPTTTGAAPVIVNPSSSTNIPLLSIPADATNSAP